MRKNFYKRAAGLFYSRDEAERTVRELRDAGYDMDNVSIVAKDVDQIGDTETTKEIGNKADDGAATGAVTGGALGGLTGLLVGLGTLAIPGNGTVEDPAQVEDTLEDANSEIRQDGV